MESHWDSWAPRIARQLDADFHTVAWSGYGLVQNCCGATRPPAVYRRASARTVRRQRLELQPGRPGRGRRPRHNGSAEVAATTPSWTPTSSSRGIAGAYGVGAELFLPAGPWRPTIATPSGRPSTPTAAGLRAHFLDQTNGPVDCCGHPSVDDDIYMATSGADFIAGVMDW